MAKVQQKLNLSTTNLMHNGFQRMKCWIAKTSIPIVFSQEFKHIIISLKRNTK